jgi:murein L,D-transpeptidase YafK
MFAKIVLFSFLMAQQISFKEKQLTFAHVKTAYNEKEQVIKKYFSDQGIEYGKFQLFIRAFKSEGKVEAWIKGKGKNSFVLLHTYDICASSGSLGPKRKEGDGQVPEGVYTLNHFNPLSSYYLSLGISYPNTSDHVLSDPKHPGGAIYIHGNCVTIGCIPITDDKIKELYILAVEAHHSGQSNIPIHIFPSRMDHASMNTLALAYPQHAGFWKNLQSIYKDFEDSKLLRKVIVNEKGEYSIKK